MVEAKARVRGRRGETSRDRAPENQEGQQIKVASKVHIETKDRPVSIISLWCRKYNRRTGRIGLVVSARYCGRAILHEPVDLAAACVTARMALRARMEDIALARRGGMRKGTEEWKKIPGRRFRVSVFWIPERAPEFIR